MLKVLFLFRVAVFFLIYQLNIESIYDILQTWLDIPKY